MRRKVWDTSVTDPALLEELADLFAVPFARDRQRIDGAFVLADGLQPHHFDGCHEAHARITAPVRFLWGTDDPWFELAAAKRMLDQFAGPTSLREVEGGKLYVHEEFPGLFAREVVEHFQAAFGGG